ncbi:MAG: peptidylprolyl isomerase [Planctomycetota bacterium]|nr:peptidylprolyl isomerase [Planctomycetota bacterium]
MTVIQRYVSGVLAVIGLLAATAGASDLKSTARGSEDQESGRGGILLRAAGIVGRPQLVRPDGSTVQLSSGGYLSLGSAVETGEDEHLAIVIAPTRRTAVEQADLIVLGPQTRVQFVSPTTATEDAGDKPVVEAVVQRGALRALVRHVGAASAFSLRLGERRVNLDGADLVVTFEPGEDDLSLRLHKGSLVMMQGDRKIRLQGGMMRTVEDGRILGARTMDRGTWDEAVALAAVPGVDMTQVLAAALKPVEKPAEAETSGEDADEAAGASTTGAQKPTITRSTPPGESAGEADPGGEKRSTQARETPPGRSGLPIISAQKPGTEKREIVEEYIYARLKTTKGDIVLELDRGRAPITVDNFLSYVKTGFYEDTVFHRVMSNFMIQAGGYDTNWEKKETGPPIKSEWPTGLRNVRGTIAMARRNTPDSATSQFFINVKNNAFLDNPPGMDGYTVFGKVIDGMDVVEAIKDAPVKQSRLNPREKAEPVEPIVIEKVEVITAEEAGMEPKPAAATETTGEE